MNSGYRVIDYPVIWTTGLFGAATSLFGAVTQDSAVAYGAALVAFLAVAAQPIINFFRQFRAAAREESAKDREARKQSDKAEIRKIVELEFEIERQRVEIEMLRAAHKGTVERVEEVEKASSKSAVIRADGH